MAEKLLCLLIFFCCLHWTQPDNINEDTEDWMQKGQDELAAALKIQHNMGVAKNVILFLADGMGVSTVTAARIYKGQRDGKSGEETLLNFEHFPHAAFAKTYSTDKQVSDSAGTATAFLGGVKANSGTLGVNARVTRQNCTVFPEGSVDTIMDWALAAGKSVGLVTTTHVTHATPAAAYAHTPERDWESDATMGSANDLCKGKVKDIATQLIEDESNTRIKVILGGGRRHFLPNTALVPGTLDQLNVHGRVDGRDLIQVWKDNKDNRGAKATYLWNKQQLDAIDVNKTDYLLGLFNQGHMSFELNRNMTGVITEPSLAEMTTAAIRILSKDDNGFFLLVEGGRIDHAHHGNNAHLALSETVAFDDAVAVAKEMTGDETLMVVTADHSHVLTMAGYPDRGHDIFGIQDSLSQDGAQDLMPYATLSYANGPGPGRVDLTYTDTTSKFHQQSRLVPMNYETHAGEDVGIYATGPMSHLFHGVHEQNYIAHVMAYASCVGPNTQHCHQHRPREPDAETKTKGDGLCESGGLRRATDVVVTLMALLVSFLWWNL
ncbi:alkaline phosphatase, tissue-nonspecific isozyme-like isoform X1 [Littorina saxatilis]|uniref:Alkaline phosphatase n=1 Tax=Littorina saxatilis TaxID=31220 RepID=A0AAN9B281_9CAEN